MSCNSPSMDLPTAKLRLAEAEYAQHQLMIGTSSVMVKDQNGETVQYNLPSAARLSAYISYLKDYVNQLEGNSCADHRGPMRFVF